MEYGVFVYSESRNDCYIHSELSNLVVNEISKELFERIVSFSDKLPMWINHRNNYVYISLDSFLTVVDLNRPLPF